MSSLRRRSASKHGQVMKSRKTMPLEQLVGSIIVEFLYHKEYCYFDGILIFLIIMGVRGL